MAVPVPKTWAAAEFVDSSEANTEWRDVFNFLLSPPRAFAYRATDKSTTSGTTTLYDMNSELYDSQTLHDNSTNNSRIVFPEPGLYDIRCHVTWAANVTGTRTLILRKNAAGSSAGGTLIIDTSTVPAAGGVGYTHIALEQQFVATDYIELFTIQTSGGALNVVAGTGNTFLSVRLVAKTA